MMMFKTWGYITMAQALTFASDFKLGHYMKIPPRPMFWGQVVATVVAGTVQLGVQAWMFTNIDGMCDPDQPNGFIVSVMLPDAQFWTDGRLVVPFDSGVRYCIHHLGCHWPDASVLHGTDLLVSVTSLVLCAHLLTLGS